MDDKRLETNKVELSGEIVSNFSYEYEKFGERFYIAEIAIKRPSETVDKIPIMVSDRMVDVKADWIGQFVRLNGQFRSFNKHDGVKTHLILTVSVKELEVLGFEEYGNKIYLQATICKPAKYRKTPLGREITDLLVAVNRSYGKSDYIPCICWGRNARFASTFEVGTHVQIWGRIQSRQYVKKINETEIEERVAYEVSVSGIEVVEAE